MTRVPSRRHVLGPVGVEADLADGRARRGGDARRDQLAAGVGRRLGGLVEARQQQLHDVARLDAQQRLVLA